MGTVSVLKAKSAKELEHILQDTGNGFAVVHFYADWAPQCQQMNSVLAELAKDRRFKNSKFVKVEAESVPEVSQRYNISAVPTCLLLKGNTELGRVNGANVPELTQKLETLQQTGVTDQKEGLDSRLRKRISSSPVMLFMKGDPQEPRCGFSKQIVAILNDQNVQFGSFNILADEEVRQGLKAFSNWPTFPQLYVNGELIGGLDIVKQMIEDGEFKEILPKSTGLDDRLESLIKMDGVMVFMKGSPSSPRCGFSRTLIELLNKTGVKYSTFDILEDEEVRQGLKKFSDWPTYPQVYVKGKLVGGLDILKDLQEAGELEVTLHAE